MATLLSLEEVDEAKARWTNLPPIDSTLKKYMETWQDIGMKAVLREIQSTLRWAEENIHMSDAEIEQKLKKLPDCETTLQEEPLPRFLEAQKWFLLKKLRDNEKAVQKVNEGNQKEEEIALLKREAKEAKQEAEEARREAQQARQAMAWLLTPHFQ